MFPPFPVRRRTLLGAGLAAPAAGLAGCSGGRAAPAEPGETAQVTFLTGLADQPWEAYLDLAEVDGHFADQGLQVTVQHGEGTGRNLILLEAGQVQFATADIATSIIEYSKGIDPNWEPPEDRPQDTGHVNFVLAAQLHNRLMAGIIALASSGIDAAVYLEGRTVAVLPGGANAVLLPAICVAAGLDETTVRQVPGDPSSFPQLLAAGEVDAIVGFAPELPSLEQGIGEPLSVIYYGEELPDVPGSGIAVSVDYAATNPDVVRRFNRAAAAGLQAVKDDPARAGRVWWQRHEGTPEWDEELAVRSCQITASYVLPEPGLQLGELDDARIMRSIALLQAVNAANARVVPESIARFDLAR